MKNHDLEMRLQAMPRRGLPPEWKSSILAAAAASPVHTPRQRHPRLSPPRWLAWSLAAAWTLVLALHLLTPAYPSPAQTSAATPEDTVAAQQRQELLADLLAFNPNTSLTP